MNVFEKWLYKIEKVGTYININMNFCMSLSEFFWTTWTTKFVILFFLLVII